MLSLFNLSQLSAFYKLYPNELEQVYLNHDLKERLSIEAFYQRDIVDQQSLIEEVKQEESLLIDENIDYHHESLNLSNEVKDLLCEHRPTTIGAATRIPGVTPAAIVMLLYYMKRKRLSMNRVVLPNL